MESYKSLEVSMHGKPVGTLATYQGRFTAFQYSDAWLNDGFAISPFSLPLQKKVYIPKLDPFDGLFGAFWDSLPDGWGRLLVDRMLLKNGVDPHAVDMLNRLAIVGESGMGALSYYPRHEQANADSRLSYDRLAEECRRILDSRNSENLDELFRLGGSSGGARPKVLTKVGGEDWIVKFPASIDRKDIGLIEYKYSLCAKKCGVEMAQTKLFPSESCEGYFGTKRFDRVNGKRIHMLSVSALLEVSHRIPSMDYSTLLALTLKLTKSYEEVEKMYRLMCFNVYAHNRDDHSNNFSFLYDEANAAWKLSPAYDLTYSNSLGGEHATCINGEGKDPQLSDMLALADKIGIKRAKAKQIAQAVQEIVFEELGEIEQYR